MAATNNPHMGTPFLVNGDQFPLGVAVALNHALVNPLAPTREVDLPQVITTGPTAAGPDQNTWYRTQLEAVTRSGGYGGPLGYPLNTAPAVMPAGPGPGAFPNENVGLPCQVAYGFAGVAPVLCGRDCATLTTNTQLCWHHVAADVLHDGPIAALGANNGTAEDLFIGTIIALLWSSGHWPAGTCLWKEVPTSGNHRFDFVLKTPRVNADGSTTDVWIVFNVQSYAHTKRAHVFAENIRFANRGAAFRQWLAARYAAIPGATFRMYMVNTSMWGYVPAANGAGIGPLVPGRITNGPVSFKAAAMRATFLTQNIVLSCFYGRFFAEFTLALPIVYMAFKARFNSPLGTYAGFPFTDRDALVAPVPGTNPFGLVQPQWHSEVRRLSSTVSWTSPAASVAFYALLGQSNYNRQ